MAGWLIALLPLLGRVIGIDGAAIAAARALLMAPSVTAALAGISWSDWFAIGEAAFKAAPEVRQALAALHPAFEKFVDAFAQDRMRASADVHAWFQQNQPETIPGYRPDGSIGPIRNPNKR